MGSLCDKPKITDTFSAAALAAEPAYRRFLLIQAKKFVKPFDTYVAKLNYPNGSQGQLNKLLACARARKRLPFYAFYSLPDEETQVMCAGNDANASGVFIADALTVK